MDIKHDERRRRFYIPLGDEEAYISYELGNGIIDLQHTIVPENEEGRGVGTALAKHALDHARENKLKVQPSCPFIKAYIDRHEEYADLEE